MLILAFVGVKMLLVHSSYKIDTTGSLLVVVGLTLTMFTNLKFIHPTRTERWRPLSLGICIAWIGFAAWAAWADFAEGSLAHWGLIVTSLYLVLAGIVQEIVPQGIRRVG